MESKQLNPLVIYHANCPDGLAAAAIAYCAWGDGAEYRAAQYGDAPPTPQDLADRDVLIVDFSYPRAVLQAMHAQAGSLLVLDHHKTAQQDCGDLPYCRFDLEESGATLMWQYLFTPIASPQWPVGTRIEQIRKSTVPYWNFASYAKARDLWQWNLPGSREISIALAAEPEDLPHRAVIATNWGIWRPKLRRAGSAMLRRDAAHIRTMVQRVQWRVVGGYNVPCVNATTLFSEVGEALCEEFPEAPFVVYYFDRGDGARQWGARSRNGFDVSVIAKLFGGGGHQAAAGWQEALP